MNLVGVLTIRILSTISIFLLMFQCAVFDQERKQQEEEEEVVGRRKRSVSSDNRSNTRRRPDNLDTRWEFSILF